MYRTDFKNLQIWQKAIELTAELYRQTGSFPRDEQFGLTSQMRRAAVSVASNIAEGSQRTTRKDFAKFVLIAKGSLAELDTQVLIAAHQSYLTSNEQKSLEAKIDALSRMLFAFHHKLEKQGV